MYPLRDLVLWGEGSCDLVWIPSFWGLRQEFSHVCLEGRWIEAYQAIHLCILSWFAHWSGIQLEMLLGLDHRSIVVSWNLLG